MILQPENPDGKKRIVFVGNGPIERDLGPLVDSADCVVRFNAPKMSIDKSGSKTTLLFLGIGGSSALHRLRDKTFISSHHFVQAEKLIFSNNHKTSKKYGLRTSFLDRLRGKPMNWTCKMIEEYGGAGKRIDILGENADQDACTALGLSINDRPRKAPSTGIIAILYLRREYPLSDWRHEICGFTSQGWDGHSFKQEKIWIQNAIENEELFQLKPPGA